jgi:hypothetical protein
MVSFILDTGWELWVGTAAQGSFFLGIRRVGGFPDPNSQWALGVLSTVPCPDSKARGTPVKVGLSLDGSQRARVAGEINILTLPGQLPSITAVHLAKVHGACFSFGRAPGVVFGASRTILVSIAAIHLCYYRFAASSGGGGGDSTCPRTGQFFRLPAHYTDF